MFVYPTVHKDIAYWNALIFNVFIFYILYLFMHLNEVGQGEKTTLKPCLLLLRKKQVLAEEFQ